MWADKYGGKTVLGFGVIWWSIATALTPLAASLGLPALLFARACMGVGEGVAMPAMNNLLSRCAHVPAPCQHVLATCQHALSNACYSANVMPVTLHILCLVLHGDLKCYPRVIHSVKHCVDI